ncbi:MAG TPA: hypothetical protein VIX89_13135 [Bryobacteraceae bacterium]
MHSRPRVSILFVSLALGFLSGCGGDPLDYETALSLLRERTTDPVRTSFSASPRFETQDPRVNLAYQRLQDAHVIQCKAAAGLGTICEPGPAGDALTQSGVSDLSLVAGRWAPSTIIAIRRLGGGSAQADVRMLFEPSELFREFEDAFDQIQGPGAMVSPGSRKQGKMVRVSYQHFDDGWHVENVE